MKVGIVDRDEEEEGESEDDRGERGLGSVERDVDDDEEDLKRVVVTGEEGAGRVMVNEEDLESPETGELRVRGEDGGDVEEGGAEADEEEGVDEVAEEGCRGGSGGSSTLRLQKGQDLFFKSHVSTQAQWK